MVRMDEELDYVSSSPLVDTKRPEPKVQDEKDISTLNKVSKMMAEEIAARKTTDRLTIDETNFTVKQQLAMNQEVARILSEFKLTVDSAINKVKEKYER
jgi:hypothetical protein